MRIVERGSGLGLALEARAAFVIGGKVGWENFDRDRAIEAGVAGPVHLAPAAGTDRRLNLVRPEARSRDEWHRWAPRQP